MSVQMVLLPVFVLVGLTFALLLWMAGRGAVRWSAARPRSRISRLDSRTGRQRATQVGNCYRNQFELPLLFYVLIAMALPLRHADLVIVLLSWVFVVTRFVACRHLRHLERSQAALDGLVRRRAGAVRDVAVFRAEDPAADLIGASLSN